MARTSLIYGVSLAVHGVLAASVVSLRADVKREVVAISMTESKKAAPEPPKPVEAPKELLEPPKEARAPARTKAAATPKAAPAEAPPPVAAAATPSLAALPDLGVELGNFGGPGGLAIPAGGGPSSAPTASVKAAPAAPKLLAPKPAEAECSEPLVKPKPKSISQPGYTSAAREANVEGRVRVEVSVDAQGHVTGARLLAGLGYGLDEVALEAARRASFEPGTRCGKAVSATFVIAMRFSL
jgi:protein TonB